MWPFKTKKLYQVSYKYYAFSVHTNTIFIKAYDLSDLQKILDKRQYPWDVEIISAKEIYNK